LVNHQEHKAHEESFDLLTSVNVVVRGTASTKDLRGLLVEPLPGDRTITPVRSTIHASASCLALVRTDSHDVDSDG